MPSGDAVPSCGCVIIFLFYISDNVKYMVPFNICNFAPRWWGSGFPTGFVTYLNILRIACELCRLLVDRNKRGSGADLNMLRLSAFY